MEARLAAAPTSQEETHGALGKGVMPIATISPISGNMVGFKYDGKVM
jgi:hypothetical protein